MTVTVLAWHDARELAMAKPKPKRRDRFKTVCRQNQGCNPEVATPELGEGMGPLIERLETLTESSKRTFAGIKFSSATGAVNVTTLGKIERTGSIALFDMRGKPLDIADNLARLASDHPNRWTDIGGYPYKPAKLQDDGSIIVVAKTVDKRFPTYVIREK